MSNNDNSRWNYGLCLRAGFRAQAIVDARVPDDRQLHAVLTARVHVLFDGHLDFEDALEAMETDAETAGGSRREILASIREKITSPLWLLEVSCMFSRP